MTSFSTNHSLCEQAFDKDRQANNDDYDNNYNNIIYPELSNYTQFLSLKARSHLVRSDKGDLRIPSYPNDNDASDACGHKNELPHVLSTYCISTPRVGEEVTALSLFYRQGNIIKEQGHFLKVTQGGKAGAMTEPRPWGSRIKSFHGVILPLKFRSWVKLLVREQGGLVG